MATTMAAAQPVPSAHAVPQSTAASPDCHGHGNLDASLLAHGPQSEGASCATCAFCQLCHTVALAPPLNALGASWEPASLPLAHLPADLSATTLPGDKPPIA